MRKLCLLQDNFFYKKHANFNQSYTKKRINIITKSDLINHKKNCLFRLKKVDEPFSTNHIENR